MRETTFKILRQGDIDLPSRRGYMVVGGPDAVCFYVDTYERARIAASTGSDTGCPVVWIAPEYGCFDAYTEVEFTEFPGWRFHSGGTGKSIAVSLVRIAADNESMAQSSKPKSEPKPSRCVGNADSDDVSTGEP